MFLLSYKTYISKMSYRAVQRDSRGTSMDILILIIPIQLRAELKGIDDEIGKVEWVRRFIVEVGPEPNRSP